MAFLPVPSLGSKPEYALLCVAIVASGCMFFAIYNRKASSPRPSSPPLSPVTSKAGLADYSTAFPPSQRAQLEAIKRTTLPATSGPLTSTSKLLQLESDYRSADGSTYVYSGFTVGEIKALGDFPDYATLSGVPLPTPAKNFDIDRAMPRPYRPFRWSYHQTMSFKKMDPDYWLELESSYRVRIRQRQELYETMGEDVLNALPGSELACKELMEMSIQFLCARYPQYFELKNMTLTNHILQTKHDLTIVDPLRVLLDTVPEDFAITLRDPQTGRYVFRAGIICSSVGWSLGTKMGLDLMGIHQPVPDYKENMAFSMDRFFTKMPTYSPIQRGSWGIEVGQPLFLPADHPDFKHRESQNPKLTPDDLNLRVDWQTLRRLPLSGAIVFNFKALFTQFSEFRNEPYVPSLVLKVLNEGKESIMKYKGTWHVEHVAKPALKEYERFQIESGLVEKDWNVQTLDENPFFPGWERKHTLD